MIFTSYAFRSNLMVGNITGEDLFYILPFDNTVDQVKMTGAQLRAYLESRARNLRSVHNGQSWAHDYLGTTKSKFLGVQVAELGTFGIFSFFH